MKQRLTALKSVVLGWKPTGLRAQNLNSVWMEQSVNKIRIKLTISLLCEAEFTNWVVVWSTLFGCHRRILFPNMYGMFSATIWKSTFLVSEKPCSFLI